MNPITLVLAGAGHAHLLVLANLTKQMKAHSSERIRNTVTPSMNIILLEPHSLVMYSGMVSGYLYGLYSQDDISVHLADYAETIRPVWQQWGWEIQIIQDSLESWNRNAGSAGKIEIKLGSGSVIWSDILSINIGAKVNLPHFKRDNGIDGSIFVPVKPLVPCILGLECFIKSPGPGEVVILGGGPSGTELALGLAEYQRNFLRDKESDPRYPGKRIGLYCRSMVLSQWRGGIQKYLTGLFKEKGIIRYSSLSSIPQADFGVLATGFVPALENLTVDSTLKLDENIFAAGDGVRVVGKEQKYGGVYPVRQAPVLLNSILSAIEIMQRAHGTQRIMDLNKLRIRGGRKYRQPGSILQILNLGPRTRGYIGVARFWGITMRGRWIFRIKDSIDRKFMQQFF